MTEVSGPVLSAPLELSFDYTRSTGPVLGAFFTALRDRRVVGIVGTDRRVHVPVVEYDPVSCEPLTELVAVGSVGTVVSWTWESQPLAGQPLDEPFAWALIKLDGADTPMAHAVRAGSAQDMSTGARVHVHWAAEPVGAITDIAYFELGDEPEAVPDGRAERDPVTMIVAPSSVKITHTASVEESTYLRALQQGRLVGSRSGPDCNVYFPAVSVDPATGQPATEYVELSDHGTVTTFCIVNIPFAGQAIKPPYVAAYILLDGADIAFLHLLTEIEVDQVRMGMRVEAVWRPREEWGLGIDNIDHFRPTGEPDADYATYEHHL